MLEKITDNIQLSPSAVAFINAITLSMGGVTHTGKLTMKHMKPQNSTATVHAHKHAHTHTDPHSWRLMLCSSVSPFLSSVLHKSQQE